MAFTYSDALTTDASKVRLAIGDTVQNTGPRPDGRNFTDNEIGYFLTIEDDRVNGATAYAFEHLASEWTAYAISEREGEAQYDAKAVATQYSKQAALWRGKPGGDDDAGRSQIAVVLTRADAYTDQNSEYT